MSSSSNCKIPPLIPLPAPSATKSDATEDLFATLFSPPTPPASPIPGPIFDSIAPTTSRPIPHTRRASTPSSDFGSFVSVSASDDPLKSEQPEPFTPLHNLDFFEKFTDGAAKSNAQNKKVLEELLQHEDDPLYWLNDNLPHTNGVKAHSGAVTPIAKATSPPPNSHDTGSLIDFDTQPTQRYHPSRNENDSRPSPSSSPPTSRSQTFSTRWLSSIRPSPSSTLPFIDNTSVEGFFDTPPHTTPRHQSSSPPTTMPHRPVPELSHDTPFSSQIFTPPSGAPGYTGDRQWNKSNFEFDTERERVSKKSIKLTGRKEMTTPVLTVEQADAIRPSFPALARLANTWTLLYSLDQHGISLNTLYSRCMNHLGPSLVVVKDSDEATFGAWMGETVKQSKGAYYGSGESFLWKFEGTGPRKLKVFRWTGKNDYVALCEPEYLSFGGGDGKYGLYLDDSLLDGSSASCPTFANEPLCSSSGTRQGANVTFECVGLEVWGVGGV